MKKKKPAKKNAIKGKGKNMSRTPSNLYEPNFESHDFKNQADKDLGKLVKR